MAELRASEIEGKYGIGDREILGDWKNIEFDMDKIIDKAKEFDEGILDSQVRNRRSRMEKQRKELETKAAAFEGYEDMSGEDKEKVIALLEVDMPLYSIRKINEQEYLNELREFKGGYDDLSKEEQIEVEKDYLRTERKNFNDFRDRYFAERPTTEGDKDGEMRWRKMESAYNKTKLVEKMKREGVEGMSPEEYSKKSHEDSLKELIERLEGYESELLKKYPEIGKFLKEATNGKVTGVSRENVEEELSESLPDGAKGEKKTKMNFPKEGESDEDFWNRRKEAWEKATPNQRKQKELSEMRIWKLRRDFELKHPELVDRGDYGIPSDMPEDWKDEPLTHEEKTELEELKEYQLEVFEKQAEKRRIKDIFNFR